MTVHDENESLGTALGQAASSVAAPRPEEMYERAVARGRQIKRRRSLGTALGGVAGLGLAGALAFVLLPGGAAPTALAPAGGSKAPALLKTVATRPAPTPSATGGVFQPTTSALATAALQDFLHALPASADPLQDPAHGAPPDSFGPAVNGETGNWYVSGDVDLKSPSSTGWSGITFSVTKGVQISTCAQAEAGSTVDRCTVTAVRGGTLILDKSVHNPAEPDVNPIWQYYWFSSAGYEIGLSVGDVSVADFALSEQQAVAVVDDPVWAGIVGRLAAPVCQGGKLTQVLPGPGTTGFNPEVKCSTTGQVYPM